MCRLLSVINAILNTGWLLRKRTESCTRYTLVVYMLVLTTFYPHHLSRKLVLFVLPALIERKLTFAVFLSTIVTERISTTEFCIANEAFTNWKAIVESFMQEPNTWPIDDLHGCDKACDKAFNKNISHVEMAISIELDSCLVTVLAEICYPISCCRFHINFLKLRFTQPQFGINF